MNELKRQLDQQLGDTTKRAERVIMNVEQSKSKQRTHKKKSFIPIFSTIITAVALLTLFLIIDPLNSDEPAVPAEEQEQTADNELFDVYRTLFKKHGDVASFSGEPAFTETTHWLNERYVSVTSNYSGMLTQQIYRITDEKLVLVLMAEVTEPVLTYTTEQLEGLVELTTVFEGPIENSEQSNGKTITTNKTFETPYQTFTNTIVVSETFENGTTDTIFAQGYGIVGVIVTSTDGQQKSALLSSVEETLLVLPPTATNNRAAYEALFKPNGTIAHFKGDGIEYSTFYEKTIWVGKNHVIVRVDNGGSIADRIFRITDEKLALIGQQVVDTFDETYSLAELEAMQELEVLFEGPIKTGTAPNGDDIFTNRIIETSYKTFANVIVTQRTETDGSINETYYASDYGIVGTRFTSADGYQVQSLLQTVDVASTDYDLVSFYSNVTTERDSLARNQLTFIDPIYTAQQIEKMGINYQLVKETAAGDIGMFSYECEGQSCGYSIVLRNGASITKTFFTSKGVEIPTISYAPMHPFVAIHLSQKVTNQNGDHIERWGILLFDANTGEVLVPDGANPEHFGNTIWPLDDIGLTNTGVLTYRIADITSSDFDTIHDWENGERRMIQYEFDLTND